MRTTPTRPHPHGRPGRRLARGLAVALPLAGALVGVAAGPASASSVTELADELVVDGDCSLREAVHAANTGAPFDGCAVPADGVVQLGAGAHAVDAPLVVLVPLTLRGVGMPTTNLDCSGLGAGACVQSAGAASSLALEDLAVSDAPSTAVLAAPGSGPLRVERSGVVGSVVGVASDDAPLTVVDSLLIDNAAAGVLSVDGPVLVQGSVLAGNRVGAAGGAATLTIERSTLMGNDEDAVRTTSGDVVIRSSTIVGNVWDAVRTADGDLRYESATVVGNRRALNVTGSGSATFRNSVLAHAVVTNCDNPVISEGHNLSDDASCAFAAAGDLIDIDSGLTGFAGDWAAMPVLIFEHTSPLADGGAGCDVTDQLGQHRPNDADGDGVAACDIGALELRAFPTPPGGDGAGGAGGAGGGAEPGAGADGGVDEPGAGSGEPGSGTPGQGGPALPEAPAAGAVTATPSFTG